MLCYVSQKVEIAFLLLHPNFMKAFQDSIFEYVTERKSEIKRRESESESEIEGGERTSEIKRGERKRAIAIKSSTKSDDR